MFSALRPQPAVGTIIDPLVAESQALPDAESMAAEAQRSRRMRHHLILANALVWVGIIVMVWQGFF